MADVAAITFVAVEFVIDTFEGVGWFFTAIAAGAAALVWRFFKTLF